MTRHGWGRTGCGASRASHAHEQAAFNYTKFLGDVARLNLPLPGEPDGLAHHRAHNRGISCVQTLGYG